MTRVTSRVAEGGYEIGLKPALYVVLIRVRAGADDAVAGSIDDNVDAAKVLKRELDDTSHRLASADVT